MRNMIETRQRQPDGTWISTDKREMTAQEIADHDALWRKYFPDNYSDKEKS